MIQDGITYFKKPGNRNTETTLDLAIEYARSSGIEDLIIASTKGDTARSLMERSNLEGLRITIVTYAFGQKGAGDNPMPSDLRRALVDRGFNVCSAAHALSGAERSLSTKFGGIYPVEIIAHTLRMFGQGMKVCIEISAMAADAGHITNSERVIAIGGTGKGADTAIVLRPEVSSKILDTHIERIICMPTHRPNQDQ